MIRYNAKGLMVFPCPVKDENGKDSILVAEECYCPNGHNLIDRYITSVLMWIIVILIKITTGKEREHHGV